MNARGTRDFPPEEKIERQAIIDTVRSIFELYGFSPLETPMVERMDILAAKYAGGAEILKETFQFKDQGNRDLGLRYDLTVPFSRFVGMNPTVKMPFKRYQIEKVFRDGPVQAGRMREFWQCDADVVGSKAMFAEAQCIQIAQRFFREIGLDVNIELNNRKILEGILKQVDTPDDKLMDAILEIDKLKKVGVDEVKNNLAKLGLSDDAITNAIGMFGVSGTNEEKINTLKGFFKDEMAIEGLKEVEDILGLVDQSNVIFDVKLARGLSYYTGPVFEVVLKDSKVYSRSLGGGGRYDKMIGDFLESKKEYPAVGISFGLEPITTVIDKLKKDDAQPKKTVTTLFIIPIGTMKDSIVIAEQFRDASIKTDIDISGRGLSKNLNFANAMNIPFVAFIGDDEIKNNNIKLKNMVSGEELFLSVDEAIEKIGENIN